MSEIACDHRIPPARAVGDPGAIGDIGEFPVDIFEKAHRHPFAYHDKIGVTIAIKIGEKCVADHADITETRGYFIRDIGKSHPPVPGIISEDEATCRRRISARLYASRDKEVPFSIVIEIEAPDTEPACMVDR